MALATATTDPADQRRHAGPHVARAVVAAGQAVIVIAALAVIVLLAWPGMLAPRRPDRDRRRLPVAARAPRTGSAPTSSAATCSAGRSTAPARCWSPACSAWCSPRSPASAIGLAAGIAPRWLNAVLMRVVDVLLALPGAAHRPHPDRDGRAPGSAASSSPSASPSRPASPGWWRPRCASCAPPSTCRRPRSSAPAAARTSVRHLLPNLMTEVVVLASSAIGWAVLTASTLSFLGLGVQLPQPDWGSDLAAGATNLATSWWLSTFPGRHHGHDPAGELHRRLADDRRSTRARGCAAAEPARAVPRRPARAARRPRRGRRRRRGSAAADAEGEAPDEPARGQRPADRDRHRGRPVRPVDGVSSRRGRARRWGSSASRARARP